MSRMKIALSCKNARMKFAQRCEDVSGRYLIYTKDLKKDGETMMIPVYMVGLL